MKKQSTEKKEVATIDWNEVKKQRNEKPEVFEGKNKQEKQPAKRVMTEEEKIAEQKRNAELLAEYNKLMNEDEKPKSEFATKDEIKEELHRKFEKGKLRKANLITMIFLIIAGAAFIMEMAILLSSVVIGLFRNGAGIGGIFDGGSDIGSILSSLGYFIYLIVILAIIAFCVVGILCAVFSIIDTARLNFLKDKDYMMNLYINRITMIEILPMIPLEFLLIFVLPVAKLNMVGILGYTMFVNIPLAIIHLGCFISIYAQALVARIRYKKSVPIEEYKQVVSEKQRLLRKERRRRTTSGGGRLY